MAEMAAPMRAEQPLMDADGELLRGVGELQPGDLADVE